MMPRTTPRNPTQGTLESLTQALETGTLTPARKMLNTLYASEIAHVLESLPHPKRNFVWELVESDNRGDVLVEVNDEVRAGLIKDMEADSLVAITSGLETDDLADLLQDFPNTVIQQVLRSMDHQDRTRLEAVLSYPEDTAGGLMNTDTITVRADVTIDVVLRYLRLRGELPPQTDSLIVVNRSDRYLGILALAQLLTCDPGRSVADVMTLEIDPIPAELSAGQVASLFETRDLISAPVIDSEERLVGRITVDDVVDVIRDEAEHSVMSMAGLDEEDDMFAPVAISSKRRAVWLGVNLLTAVLTAWVIGLFQDTLEQIVALAVLITIVPSMGGIAGGQTLVLMIRGLALGQVSSANSRWLLMREIAVSAVNGVLWAGVVASIVAYWFNDIALAAIIATAMIINLLSGAIVGVSVPLTLRKMGIDPALAGTVILTTVTDVVGIIAFLGLATLFLV